MDIEKYLVNYCETVEEFEDPNCLKTNFLINWRSDLNSDLYEKNTIFRVNLIEQMLM